MIHDKRVKLVNEKDILDGPIVYWMNREMRTKHNWSLAYAQELAVTYDRPLVVVYNLVPNFLGGCDRNYAFKIGGLEKVEKSLKEKNIPFTIIVDPNGKSSGKYLIDFFKSVQAGAVVSDLYPLRLPQQWATEVGKKIHCGLFIVDAHNFVPLWEVSDKKEYAAYTIRPKVHRLLKEFSEKVPSIKKQRKVFNGNIQKINWKELKNDTEHHQLDWIRPGEDEAQKFLKKFIKDRLPQYATERNDPNNNVQSDLSPYLHYGMISVHDIAHKISHWIDLDIHKIISSTHNKAKLKEHFIPNKVDHAGAFLEELIVRGTLADNFCYFEPNYDSIEGFPDWSKKSHAKHASDKREYLYSSREFENAETHDDLWNACQLQMVKTGKMHGYVRMYWAKKILEWSKNISEAHKIAIYLNDKYELDGREPNGYVGIAWSIGGVHDRPWFEREIFGQIRYMARSGCEKKFDVDQYITTWAIGQDTLL